MMLQLKHFDIPIVDKSKVGGKNVEKNNIGRV